VSPKIIAVTGSMASGKSTAFNILTELGFTCFDADLLGRESIYPNSPTLKEIIALFGNEYLNSNGTLNREKLGRLVFADKDALKNLEEIMHPAIEDLLATKVNSLHNAMVVFYFVPLLFEKSQALDKYYKTVVITAPEKELLKRAKLRSDLTFPEIKLRLSHQLSQEEKCKRADFVIDNSSSIEDLRLKLINFLQLISD
jgi:dephospho-CoA kinase